MLFFVIVLAQGVPAPASLPAPISAASPSVTSDGPPPTAPGHAWTGACPGVDAGLFESLEKASLEAVQAQLFDAKTAVGADRGNLSTVVKASAIAMELRRRQRGQEAVAQVRACHKQAMLGVPDPEAPGHAWWLMSDAFFFDYVKYASGKANIDRRLVACAAITPFQNALKLRDIKGVPRRLRTIIPLLPKEEATGLSVQVLRDTASTGAAFDLLPELASIARTAGLTHPQFDWYESVGWTCLDQPRKALPLLEHLAKAMPDNKAVLENLQVERGRVDALDGKSKTSARKKRPTKKTVRKTAVKRRKAAVKRRKDIKKRTKKRRK